MTSMKGSTNETALWHLCHSTPFGSKKNSKMKNLPAVLILGVLLSTQMCVTNGGKLQACFQKSYVCTDAPNCLQLRQTWPTITAYHETNSMLCGVKCLNFTLSGPSKDVGILRAALLAVFVCGYWNILTV